MYYGKRRLFFLTKEQIKEGWILTRHMPDRRERIRFTVRQWSKFNVDKQMYLTKIFHVILTDHRTRNEKLAGIVKAILRPTPTQRIHQKKKLDNAINKIHRGIDAFDKGMDEFSKGLNQSVSKGTRDDPVKLIMGDRNHTKKHTKKSKGADPVDMIMGKKRPNIW